uniref:Uncharacterized protein n=1 Tax=Gallus gallus TaxID=9031 RepID=A0A8V1A9Z1_CHICK
NLWTDHQDSQLYISHGPCGSYLNPSTPAFANSIRHSSTRRVNHRHQSYKAEFFYRKVYFVCVKLEAFRELVIRQSQVTESCNTSKPMFILFLPIGKQTE